MRIGLALSLLFLSLPASALPRGYYRLGELGVVEIDVEEGHVQGRYVGEGACQFAAGQQILLGQFEGDVFAGTLVVCQRGQGCLSEQPYPAFGFELAGKGAVLGINLAQACSSPAGSLARVKADPLRDSEARAVARPKPLKAAVLKQKFEMHAQDGARSEKAGDLTRAARSLELAISYFPDDWYAYAQAGDTYLQLKNWPKAIARFDRARKIALDARAKPENVANLKFAIGEVYAAQGDVTNACAWIRQALATPGFDSGRLLTDSELDPIRESVEFKQLTAAVPARGP